MKRRTVLGLTGTTAAALAGGYIYASNATSLENTTKRGHKTIDIPGIDHAAFKPDPNNRFNTNLEFQFTDTPPEYWRFHRPDGKLLADGKNPGPTTIWETDWGFPVGHKKRGDYTLVTESNTGRSSQTISIRPRLNVENIRLTGTEIEFTVSNPEWVPNYIARISLVAKNRFIEEADLMKGKRVYHEGQSHTWTVKYPFDTYGEFSVQVYDGEKEFTANTDLTA